MKRKRWNGAVLLLLLLLAFKGADAEAAPQPWPTHAPGATPYVRVYDAKSAPSAAEAEPASFESIDDMWAHFYTKFGRFYSRDEEYELFRSLPPDEPYSFVPHSAYFMLDEGEAMRMARYFDGLDGCEARVIAQHTIVGGVEQWDYLTVVTMTPSRFFALSEEPGESFMIERFHDAVRDRFDADYWPDGIYEQSEEALKAYEKRGCFYFEDGTLERLENLDRDTICSFTLREYTPGGWDQYGLKIAHVLYRADLDSDLYIRHDKWESVCVVSVMPAELSVLSGKLPGRYLVRLAEDDETALAGADDILPFGPNREVFGERTRCAASAQRRGYRGAFGDHRPLHALSLHRRLQYHGPAACPRGR
jgi:hypothetical protein